MQGQAGADPEMGQGPGRPMGILAQHKVYMVERRQNRLIPDKNAYISLGLSSQALGRGPACPGPGSAPGGR